MKAIANIRNLESEKGKNTILRNLGRILDICIIDIDIDNGLLFFLYANPLAFEKVKQELFRIGYPLQSFQNLNSSTSTSKTHNFDSSADHSKLV